MFLNDSENRCRPGINNNNYKKQQQQKIRRPLLL